MSAIRIGLNGLGRIGRGVIREIERRKASGDLKNVEIVAVNNPGKAENFLNLLKHDSLHGRFPGEIKLENDHTILAGSSRLHFFNQRDPSEIDWSSEKVDIVIDATGVFKDQEGLGKLGCDS